MDNNPVFFKIKHLNIYRLYSQGIDLGIQCLTSEKKEIGPADIGILAFKINKSTRASTLQA